MDEKARNNLFNSDNGAEYKYQQAKYENDAANGSLSKAQEAKAKYGLNQAKVGSKFSKETRDYYSLNKTELYDVLSNDPNGQAIADQIVSYGDALESNGLGNNKFRDSKGNVSQLRQKPVQHPAPDVAAVKLPCLALVWLVVPYQPPAVLIKKPRALKFPQKVLPTK
jgi:hypothetical protein